MAPGNRATELFERFVAGGEATIDQFIAEQVSEELYIDYKRVTNDGESSKLEQADKENFARAVCGFGNSEGGVIVWGVDCRRDPKRGDVPSSKHAIRSVKRFLSFLEGATSGCTLPPLDGTRHHVLEQPATAEGYVVTLVPKSMYAPHQCIVGRYKDRYYIRVGSNFELAPHGLLAGMFGKQPTPNIFHMWTSLEGLRVQIAAREKAEAELRQLASGLEVKLRRLVDANVIGIVIWNLEGAITEANEAFLQMVQHSREDLVSGRVRWMDLTPAEWRDRDERAIAELKTTGIFQQFEKEYFRKDGSRVPVLIGGALFEKGGNEGVAFVLNLSEQKHAEEALRQTQEDLQQTQAEFAHVNRVMTIGELAASIAHEVNQPLAAIVASGDSCTAWLANEPPNLDKARAAASRIVQAATQASEVVHSIRALFKKNTSMTASVDVNELIEETISFVRPEAERKSISMRTDLGRRLADLKWLVRHYRTNALSRRRCEIRSQTLRRWTNGCP